MAGAFGMGMPGGSSEQLNGPPPSPQGPNGNPSQLGAGLSQGLPVPSGMLPPEILTGMMQAASSIDQQFDSFAQVTPDLAQDWAALKAQLQSVMAKLLVAGGTAPSPTAPGQPFPAGGMAGGGTVAPTGA